MSVSNREEAFIVELPKDWNGAAAAIRAGYSPDCAAEQASRLLSKANVIARIEQIKASMSGKAAITMERLLIHLSKLAFADRTSIFDDDGTILPISQWPEDVRTCIVGIEVEELPFGLGSIKKVKLCQPEKYVEMLMKYLGGFELDNNQKADQVHIYEIPNNGRAVEFTKQKAITETAGAN